MAKIIKFSNNINVKYNNINNTNRIVYRFSGYPYNRSFPSIIKEIIRSNKKNIEIISHYDLLPQLLHISYFIKCFYHQKLLKRNISNYYHRIIYINSIIFNNFIKIKLINSFYKRRSTFYIGAHIRMGDYCMMNHRLCKINKYKVSKLLELYNKICNKRRCSLVIGSDSKLFISFIKKYKSSIITYKEEYEVIHSSGLSRDANYSLMFYTKLVVDINMLVKSDYLILSPHSTFSLLILYIRGNLAINYSSFIFLNGKRIIYDPLFEELKKRRFNDE